MRRRIESMIVASTREIPNPDDPLLEATKSEPGLSDRTISPFTKKNSLSCTSGPPNEPPAWMKLRLGLATTGCPRTVLPSKSWLRPNVYAEPWNSLDRKSTRLNSSHGYISYAVFCLKKKKKKQTCIRSAVHTRRCLA